MITKQMKQQPHMMMTALITIILAVFGSIETAVGEVTPTYDATTKTLTLKFTSAGDFSSYSSHLTDEYKAASIVIFDGPELNDADVNIMKNFKSSIIDLRKVNTVSTNTSHSGWGFSSDVWPYNSSIVFPDKTPISTLKSLTSANYLLNLVSADGNKFNVATTKTDDNKKIIDLSSVYKYVKGDKGSFTTLDLACNNSYTEGFFENADLDGITNLVLENAIGDNLYFDPKCFTGLKHIKRVVLPTLGLNSSIDSYNNENSSVEVYQALKKKSDTETVCQINIVKAGGLAALKDAPYTSDNIKNAYCFDIYGTANKDDYGAMNSIDNPRLNLSQMTFDANDFKNASDKLTALDQIKNPHIKYLALPDAGDEVSDPLFTTLRKNMDNLIGVAYYCKAKKSYTCYTSEEGNVHFLTEMTENVTKIDGAGNPNKGIDNLKISGNVNAKDVSANGWSARYDKDGHFALVSDAENVIGGTTKFDDNGTVDSKNSAFVGSNGVIKLDLSDAKFTNPADLTLSMTSLVGNRTTTVLIPTDKSITKLPADFLNVPGANSIKDICIPYNIKIIGARAFYGLNYLNHVTTTDKDGNPIDKGYDKKYELTTLNDEAGKEYQDQVLNPDEIDTKAGSMTFSSHLQEIDSYAFGTVSYVKDVYVLAGKAPACHVNAFSSKMYVGNTGFNPRGGITRADFINGDSWITMLHYPKEIQGKDDEKRYTDVTRDYTITDADGNADGNGNLIKWPNQSEFTRSYQQATNGYLWKAWDAPRTAWSNLGSYPINLKDDKSGKESFTSGFDMKQDEANEWFHASKENDKSAIFYHTSVDGSTDGKNDVDGGDYANVKTTDGNQLYNDDYRGWHQFVLASSYDYGNETPSHNFSYINDNGWWTICVPFKMTKAEVRKMFGYHTDGKNPDNLHVCEFTGVMRDATADNGNGKIVLHFDRDVYNYVYDKDGNKTLRADDEDVIKAGVPYLLQPDFKMKTDGIADFIPSNQVLKDDRCKAVSSADLRKMAMEKVVEVTATGDSEAPKYKYTFVGNFWQTEMPQYSYFLAWYEKEKVATFFWQEDQPTQTLNWNAYTAIIGCNWSEDDRKFYIPSGDFGNVHWFTRKGNDVKGKSVFSDDSFETSKGAGAKGNGPENVSIEAAGNTADGITKVHFGDRTIEMFHGKVYNLNGQYVGDSLEGLPKGIYIAAGKKYVVK